VIADVRMPEMSGIELQSRLWDRGSSLPFFITVVSEESLRARALRNCAICFLTKPFGEAVLIKSLRTAVEQRRRAGETSQPAEVARPDGRLPCSESD
jgi:two-component system response regulator FixJ